MDKVLLTPVEAAEMLGIGRSNIYELMRSGVVKSVRIGTWLVQAMAERAVGVDLTSRRVRVDEFLQMWLDDIVRPGTLAMNTKRSYADAVRLHITPNIGNLLLGELQHQHVVGMLIAIRDAGKGASLMKTCREVIVVTVQSARGDDVTAPAEDGNNLLCVAKTASAPGQRTTTFRATALGSTTLTSSDSFSSGDLSRDVYSLSVTVAPGGRQLDSRCRCRCRCPGKSLMVWSKLDP